MKNGRLSISSKETAGFKPAEPYFPVQDKFLSKSLKRLLNSPAYFLRFISKYLKTKKSRNSASDTKAKIKKTEDVYGFLWRGLENKSSGKWHYNNMQEAIKEPIVRGEKGVDIGSGCGYDTFIMAKKNPSVKIFSLEISDGVFAIKKLTRGLNNVWVIKGSALNIPLADNALDFAYSFGVLHHTPDPESAVREIFRVVKKSAPVYLYLYEDHSENRVKCTFLKIIKLLRIITVRLPEKFLYSLSFLASPFVIILFTLPSMFLKKFRITQPLSERIPFNFGRSLFSLTGDLYDRFGAPIEHRFSRKEIFDLLNRNGFANISVTRMRSAAGWVTWGYKR